MKRLSLLILAIAAASIAAALTPQFGATFPTIFRNNWERPRLYAVIDSAMVPGNGRRSIYNIVPAGETGVRAPVDSLVGLWQAGGSTPTFRRIQHLQIWVSQSGALTLTVFDDAGTTRNTLLMDSFVIYDLRIEADSIQVTNPGGTPATFSYEVW